MKHLIDELNQIKREIREYFSENDKKNYDQDKQINDLYAYLRNHLSDSVFKLFEGMQESGKLDEIITSAITDVNDNLRTIESLVKNKMKFYLPSGMNYSYGQFMCLGVTDTTACLFDTGHKNDYEYNLNYLKSILNGRKLDYVFISHYHGDHTGGLSHFKALYKPTTKFYVAMNPQNYYTGTDSVDAVKDRNSVVNFLDSHNYLYYEVEKETVIKLEDAITLTLMNNTPEAFSYYKNNGTDTYNNYSMVIDAKIQNRHVLLGFDASDVSQKYLNSVNKVNKCDVLFNFHHGNLTNCDFEYMLKLNPDIVIDTLPPSNLDDIDGTESYNRFPTYNYRWYSNARNDVIFEVNPFSVEIEKGDIKTYSIRNHNDITVWLDTDYKGSECIGTQTKPFTSFNQIFELIPKSCQSVTVNVRGKRIITNQRFYNTFNKLVIKGDPNSKTELFNFQLDNCHKVEISDLKFTDNIVYVFNSDVRFTNCEFTIIQTQNVNITNSKVSFNTCVFKGGTREAIYSNDKSIIRLNTCEINAPEYGVNCETTILFVNNNTIKGTKNYYRMFNDCEIIALKSGSTAQRPDFGESYYCNGYTYFDSEINRLVYYDHDAPYSKWKTADGLDA